MKPVAWATFECTLGHRFESLISKKDELDEHRKCRDCEELDETSSVMAHFTGKIEPLQRAFEYLDFQPYVEKNASKNGQLFKTRHHRDEFLAKNNLTYDKRSDIRKDEKTAVEDLTFEEVMAHATDIRRPVSETSDEGGTRDGGPDVRDTVIL